MSRLLGQILTYAAFAAVIGLFSAWPEYHMLDQEEAVVSLSFSHAAQRMGECRQLSQAELNELPPNMRKPNSCPRERHSAYVEVRADNEVLFAETLSPSGLWQDGKINVYHRSTLSAGEYRLFIGMNDSGRDAGFDYEHTADLRIGAGQNLVIGFNNLSKTFVIE
ncbi:MAG: hypothetical protein ACR2Q3_10105 [Woeseiaceae bacterium]